MAPSWAFEPHAFGNGWALVALVAGLAALGLALGPGALGLSTAGPAAAVAVLGGRRAVARARVEPWRGGAVAGRVAQGLAVAALVVWGLGALG